jgi:hypothetical protein
VNSSTAFWDSSALIPLCVQERTSNNVRALGVVTDGDIYMVAAGKEEQGRPLRPKLIVLLRRVDPVNRLLHFRRRHPGAKQQNIRPEIRRGGPRRKSKTTAEGYSIRRRANRAYQT